MAKLASLVEFLNTGILGPLRPGMTMNEVARLLGPPTDWLADDAFGVAPHYWLYEYLEIAFDCLEGSFRSPWFQIENAEYLKGDVVELAKDLFLSLDGLENARMVDILRKMRDIDSVRVSLYDIAGFLRPYIFVGNSIEIVCCSPFSDRDDPDEEFEEEILKVRDIDEIVRKAASHSAIDSIYSFADADDGGRTERALRGKRPEAFLSGREFLNRLARPAA